LIITIYDIAFLIALALLSARLFGFLISKINLPAVIGEILAGFILAILGFFFFKGQVFTLFGLSIVVPHLDCLSAEFDLLAEIGILFLMFISGLSTNIRQLKTMGRPSFFIAIGGIIVPFLFGFSLTIFNGYSLNDSFILGLMLIATSVGITVRSLMDIQMLDNKIGVSILGGAVIDDVLGIVLLSFIIGSDPLLLLSVKIAFFFFIFVYIGLRIIDRVLGFGEKIDLPKAFLSISLAIFLLYSFFADRFGISGIIGAFFAGLIISNSVKSRKIIDDVQTLGYGFFIPLFFIWIGIRLFTGIQYDFISLYSIGFFAILVVIFGILGKIIGCGIGARIAGFSTKESLQVGIGMIPRMELALIIVSTAISRNFLSTIIVEHQFLAITVFLTFITTIITPILIKKIFKIENE
jgi:Kef-type K+ transport system membrane component KefB